MKLKTNQLLLAAAVICLLSLAVMTGVLLNPVKTVAPFTPPPFEEKVENGVPVVPEMLGWGELDAQAFKVSVCGNVIIRADAADLWFTNPKSNEVWLKLRILDEKGNILGETGLLKPGQYVRTVHFDTVPKAGTPIGLKLMAYEPDTYYSAGAATLNTVVAGS